MRARRKGTDNPYTRVEKVQLQDSDILYNVDVMEFEPYPIEMPDTFSTKLKTYGQIGLEDHWQEVRERAAIAAMQSLIREKYDASNGYLFAQSIAVDAVEYADALVEKLKNK